MQEEQSRRSLLPVVRNQQYCRNWFDSIQVKHQPLEYVSIMFLGPHQTRGCGFVVPGQIAEQAPEFASTALLIELELGSGRKL
jgi:hypothetical protein